MCFLSHLNHFAGRRFDNFFTPIFVVYTKKKQVKIKLVSEKANFMWWQANEAIHQDYRLPLFLCCLIVITKCSEIERFLPFVLRRKALTKKKHWRKKKHLRKRFIGSRKIASRYQRIFIHFKEDGKKPQKFNIWVFPINVLIRTFVTVD